VIGWGCTCGRFCDPGARFCEACGGPASKGEELASEAAKKAFLAKAEANDARALRGVRKKLIEGEKSYRAAADELYAHATADYAKIPGWFGEWLRGTGGADPYGGSADNGYGLDDYDWDDLDD